MIAFISITELSKRHFFNSFVLIFQPVSQIRLVELCRELSGSRGFQWVWRFGSRGEVEVLIVAPLLWTFRSWRPDDVALYINSLVRGTSSTQGHSMSRSRTQDWIYEQNWADQAREVRSHPSVGRCVGLGRCAATLRWCVAGCSMWHEAGVKDRTRIPTPRTRSRSWPGPEPLIPLLGPKNEAPLF